MKRIIKDYFTFSKKERVAITALLLLIACFIAMPYLYPGKHKPPKENKALAAYIAKNKNGAVNDSAEEKVISSDPAREKFTITKKENFPFDPNTVTPEEWQRLGLAAKTARTIINYRNKGGKFRTAEDIRKIWGIKKEDAERLIPFVRIEKSKPDYKESFVQKETPKQTFTPVPRKQIEVIEINSATEEEWKALPGIGEVLAKRILKFREHSGGFISVDQVRKTYGLADSVFQRISPYLTINLQALPKLDLNLVSAYDLRRKLNMEEVVAKAVILFRKQNGPFTSVNGLNKISLVSDTMFQRIAPLLKIE